MKSPPVSTAYGGRFHSAFIYKKDAEIGKPFLVQPIGLTPRLILFFCIGTQWVIFAQITAL